MQISTPAITIQSLSIAPLTTVYEAPSDPQPERITYSKAVQTAEEYQPRREELVDEDSDEDRSLGESPRARKRLSRRERDREEELRQNLRKEIEEELRAIQQSGVDGILQDGASTQQKYPSRTLTDEELNAVTSSGDFAEFVERSSKVIERALDQEYDILADYAARGVAEVGEEDDFGAQGGRKGRRVREIAQFWDERWSKKRMISDIDFSPKVCP